jgi:hypothetical protein
MRRLLFVALAADRGVSRAAESGGSAGTTKKE